jgi:metal-sulfur cluster biosynthetic enzyme
MSTDEQPIDEQAGEATAKAADEGQPTEPESVQPSTENDYIEALKQVIDPELMINIVDLGLIYSVSQDEEDSTRVGVEMTLTSPACPAGPQIVQQAKMALERLHDVSEAMITMTMSPPWTPERMTDEARDQLGIF